MANGAQRFDSRVVGISRSVRTIVSVELSTLGGDIVAKDASDRSFTPCGTKTGSVPSPTCNRPAGSNSPAAIRAFQLKKKGDAWMRQIFGTLIVIGILLASNSRSAVAQYAPSGPIVLNGDPVSASLLPPSNYACSNFLNRSLTPGSWSRDTQREPHWIQTSTTASDSLPMAVTPDSPTGRQASILRYLGHTFDSKKLRTIETISLHCLVESSPIGHSHPDRWRRR